MYLVRFLCWPNMLYRSLSSPFMDGTSACGFFDMILGLFIEADVNTAGKIVGMSFKDLRT